jgi:hypothetical protein
MPIPRGQGRGVLAISLAAGLSITACSSDSTNPSTERKSDGPAAAIIAKPQTRADSLVAVRQVARALALAFADNGVRNGFLQAFRGSRVAESKLEIQRFLKGNGQGLARKVEQITRLSSGELDRALAGLEELELYLPIPSDRQNWHGTDDILVAGFIETDTELRRRGTVVAYDTRGNATTISYTQPSTRPVIVLTNVESQYAADGQSSPSLAAGSGAKHPAISFQECLDCVPPPPPPPPDPCLSSSTATNLYVCRAFISNIGQYEGLLRGSPETSMLLFSELPNGTGMTEIGCINEDQTGSRFYNQDSDNFTGKALIGNKTAIDQAHAGGRGVLMLIWEDDQGSKCSFQTSSSAKRRIFNLLDLAGAGVSLWWLACAANGSCDNGPPTWLAVLGFGVSLISEIILGNDDDLIGAGALPAGVDPTSTPVRILFRESSTSGTQQRGTVSLATKP